MEVNICVNIVQLTHIAAVHCVVAPRRIDHRPDINNWSRVIKPIFDRRTKEVNKAKKMSIKYTTHNDFMGDVIY